MLADDEDIDAEDPNEFKNKTYDELVHDFRSVKRKRPVVAASCQEEPCLLCSVKLGQTQNKFYSILSDNLGSMDFDQIVLLMHGYWMTKIYPEDPEGEEITPEVIRNHILNCLNEPLIEYYVQIQQYKNLRDMLFDSLAQANMNGDRLYDFKIMSNIERINARILALYKEKPSDGLFASPQLNLQ